MRFLPALILAGAIAPIYSAQAYQVNLNFSNLSGGNGAALSPIFIALQDGGFNPYTPGSAASPAIVQLAETGSGAGLAGEFNQSGGLSVEVTAMGGFGPGIYLPGQTGGISLNLDPVANRYLSFFSMVVPSNDRFVGGKIELFDAAGNFLGANSTLSGNAIWDAGAVASQLAGAAFLVNNAGGNTPTPGGVISLNDNFAVYAGQLTPAGYNFSNLPGDATPLLNISAVAAVPLPAAAWLFGGALPLLGGIGRRKAV